MAERPSVKDILAAARKGGAAKPAGEPISQSEREAGPPDQDPSELADLSSAPEPLAAAPTVPVVPPAPTGRPLSLKEKLAAARAGVAPAPTAPAPAAEIAVEPDLATPIADVPLPAAAAAAPTPTPAASLGRPMSLKEKLAAARGVSAPAAAPAAGGKPSAGAVKAAPAAVVGKLAADRALPPLEKIADPRDMAEALRRAGAEKDKTAKATAAARAAEKEGATPARVAAVAKAAVAPKLPASKTVPPKPSKSAALAATQGQATGRRPFLSTMGWVIVVGWGTFTAGLGIFSAMLVRFMFPNVLAEPPSTIKVGVPSNFEKGEVNERWKAEWGFWIVRSTFEGQDEIYALQSVCTHLGCPPNWLAGEQKFKCPCHGSGFYISGINFEGPAPRPLERFKVALSDDGQILVDKSQKFQHELEQWKDPDSFIPV